MWFRLAISALIAGSCAGCAPRLQIARWQDMTGAYAATIRCTAYGTTLQAELATDSTITARAPTPEEP